MSQILKATTARKNLKKLSFRDSFDLPLAIIVITLFAVGLLMVYSASWQMARSQGNAEYDMVLRQLVIGIAGMAAMVVITFIDYHRLRRWVVPGMVFIALLLVAVLLFGQSDGSSPRRGLFAGSVQPSEFAKLMIIIYLAFWLDSKKETMDHLTFGLIPLLAIVGCTAGLILAQPDVSAAATIIVLGVSSSSLRAQTSPDSPRRRYYRVLGFVVVKLSTTASTRLLDYWNGLQNPEQASDHVKWSLEAIINGGVFGVGIGRSTTNSSDFQLLPPIRFSPDRRRDRFVGCFCGHCPLPGLHLARSGNRSARSRPAGKMVGWQHYDLDRS